MPASTLWASAGEHLGGPTGKDSWRPKLDGQQEVTAINPWMHSPRTGSPLTLPRYIITHQPRALAAHIDALGLPSALVVTAGRFPGSAGRFPSRVNRSAAIGPPVAVRRKPTDLITPKKAPPVPGYADCRSA